MDPYIALLEIGMFAILFSLFLEFVMANVKSLLKEFKPDTNISFDTRYAGDTPIVSTAFEKPQRSTEELQEHLQYCFRDVQYPHIQFILLSTIQGR